jgi:IS30 family transposase
MPDTQLTTEERYRITHMNMFGWSSARIGRAIGRHRATVGRELARNRDCCGWYHYESAERLAKERRTCASQRYKLDNSDLGHAVQRGLLQRWSPEQIAGRLKVDHTGDKSMQVTHETIYRWIYRRHSFGEHWGQWLRRRRIRRRRRIPGERLGKRGQIPGRVGIEQRPQVVNDRSRCGDWESDTVEGAKGKGLLVTHVERKSRYLRIGQLSDKRAEPLANVTCRLLGRVPRQLRHTLTADNGKEFTQFRTIEKRLKMDVYFANPHSPWERGTNENTNSLLRDYFPKGCDLSQVTAAQLASVERMLNNRPRKCLNYRSPLEVLNALPGVALRN